MIYYPVEEDVLCDIESIIGSNKISTQFIMARNLNTTVASRNLN